MDTAESIFEYVYKRGERREKMKKKGGERQVKMAAWVPHQRSPSVVGEEGEKGRKKGHRKKGGEKGKEETV